MGQRNGKHVLMNAASVRDLTKLTATVDSTDSAHILLTAALQEALHNLQQMGYNACRITDSFPFSSERHKTARNHKSMSSHQKHLIDGYFELSLISILLFNLAELFFFSCYLIQCSNITLLNQKKQECFPLTQDSIKHTFLTTLCQRYFSRSD